MISINQLINIFSLEYLVYVTLLTYFFGCTSTLSSQIPTMGEVKLYTRADVAIRDGCKGEPVWIIYKDSVYDLTKYVDEVTVLLKDWNFSLRIKVSVGVIRW